MRRLARLLVIAVGLVAHTPRAGLAQPPTGPEPGRVELGIGWMWAGRTAIGSNRADETTSAGGALALFSTSTALAGGSGLEGRAGFTVAGPLEVEATGRYAVRQLRTQIGGDYENAAAVSASETIRQFALGGALLWFPRRPPRPTRVAPFLLVGAGYLRELHEGSVLVDTGRFYFVGGGLEILARPESGTFMRGGGLRVDVRAATRTGGIAGSGRAPFSPELGAAVFVRF